MWGFLWEAPLGSRRAPDPCLNTWIEPTTWPGWWWCAPDSSNELPALRLVWGAVGNYPTCIRINYMLVLALSSPKRRLCCLLSAWETSALLTLHLEKGCRFQVSHFDVPWGLSFLGLRLASLVHGSNASDLFEYQSWHPGDWLTCSFFLCKDAPSRINGEAERQQLSTGAGALLLLVICIIYQQGHGCRRGGEA